MIFCVFLSFEGCSWLRKIKRKLTEFLERSYRNSRFSWYRTILFWAGFVWVGSCTGWVEWELNQQSRVWGALVWGSSGAGSWELKGLLILFRDFLQIVSGDTVQGYYQTLSYIYTFGVWCLVICYELICDQTLSLLLSLRELESWGVHWFYLGFSYGFYQVILYRVITKLFHIFTLFGYGVWIFYGHIGDQTLSFIYTCLLLLLLRLKSGLVLAKFLLNLKKKKKEFYIKFESPCRFYAKYFLLSMFV